ncbi:hypothetical protein EYY80_06955 [Klebsiella oxytoca]|nr:hypothetical protein [Klebsiella oxytoca]TBM01453.1 hypothetical protein EYY80_06955 [Klebsiella oxytoca]HAU6244299.1 hypothetical protein [Klebsiella oxytoca]HAU6250424.1 hypothetical protein [Klebsiella oxytoca]HAU6256930.1 hypothetical protein [Klebsiella oxytoca]
MVPAPAIEDINPEPVVAAPAPEVAAAPAAAAVPVVAAAPPPKIELNPVIPAENGSAIPLPFHYLQLEQIPAFSEKLVRSLMNH